MEAPPERGAKHFEPEGASVKETGRFSRAWVIIVLVLAAAGLLLAGCGKKEWPSPRAEKDRFTWDSVSASRDETCLIIRGELQGATQNLQQVELRLETSEELCPGCPFTPQSSTVYSLDDPSLSRQGSSVVITHCPVDPDTAVRFRLNGINIFEQIPGTLSDTVELKTRNATRSEP